MVAMVGLLSAVAVGGAVMGVRAMTSSPSAPATPPAAAQSFSGLQHIHQDIITSFGVVAVEILQKNAGVSPKSVSSSTHFPSYVGPDKLEVQTTVNIRNSLSRPLRFDAGQFSVVAGGKRYRVTRATVDNVRMQPDALLDENLSFVVPRKGEPLVLEFADPSSSRPIRIDLGRAQARVTDPGGHAH